MNVSRKLHRVQHLDCRVDVDLGYVVNEQLRWSIEVFSIFEVRVRQTVSYHDDLQHVDPFVLLLVVPNEERGDSAHYPEDPVDYEHFPKVLVFAVLKHRKLHDLE